MSIFKEKLDEEYLTIGEAKEILEGIEAERAAADDRELRYELARAIQHVNRFATLDPAESEELVTDLRELEKVNEETGYKLANLLPEDRAEVRSVYAQQRYSLSTEEIDDILDVIAKYV
ncbi:MAG: DNA-directed RNA polymerase, subunit F [uncultured archaeon A07HR60]|jgi:DNA-directed RNA polymerase, subunit F (EC 2.7.7.6)|nr:MAG: DNA-directed RNA polymerase, subunit F [uncultured archaeon A07HR60]